jgi:hypothetical protein
MLEVFEKRSSVSQFNIKLAKSSKKTTRRFQKLRTCKNHSDREVFSGKRRIAGKVENSEQRALISGDMKKRKILRSKLSFSAGILLRNKNDF